MCIFLISDIDAIKKQQDVVEELTKNEGLFFGIQLLLSHFLDLDHLLSMCIQIPKQETVKTADNKIVAIIFLKHTLEEVEALKTIIASSDNDTLMEYTMVRYGRLQWGAFFSKRLHQKDMFVALTCEYETMGLNSIFVDDYLKYEI